MQADCIEGRLLINPGSATGAFNSLHEGLVPSFVLMDITGKKVKISGRPSPQVLRRCCQAKESDQQLGVQCAAGYSVRL